MIHHHLGTCLVLLFVVSQAAREVCFAGALRTLGGHPAARARNDLATAGAWPPFFPALKVLGPAIVGGLHGGAGPIAILVLARRP